MRPEHDDGLSSDAQDLLRSVRDADDPSADDRARVRRAMSAALIASTAAVSTTVASSAAASTVATGSALAIGTKLTIAALLVTGLGAAVVLSATSVRGPDEPAPVRTTQARHVEALPVPVDETIRETDAETIAQSNDELTEISAAVTTEEAIPEALAETRAAQPVRAARRSPVPLADLRAERDEVEANALPTPAIPASTLPLELPLMRQARAAIARGDHASALDALRDHEARFPNGVLAIEREAARALASCQSDAPDGVSRGAMFLASHGAHPMADRVATACGITR